MENCFCKQILKNTFRASLIGFLSDFDMGLNLVLFRLFDMFHIFFNVRRWKLIKTVLSRGQEYLKTILRIESFLNHGITSIFVRKIIGLWHFQQKNMTKQIRFGSRSVYYSRMACPGYFGIQKKLLVFKKW